MYRRFKFWPILFTSLKSYNVQTFRADLSAGVTVGVIALPMAMAFAIGSNVSPTAGLITAVVAGFLSAFLGGSTVAACGPTGAFVAIVAGIVATHGLSGLLICTMMAGVMLFLMGLFRLGGLIRFIPAPLIKGFTTGIAIIILGGQIKDFLGINADTGHGSLIDTIAGIIPHLGETNLITLAISVVSVLVILLWPKRIGRYIPGSIAVLIIVTAACAILSQYYDLGIATIGSKFGGIPRSLPLPSMPQFDLETFQRLLTPAVTIALLGAIESLLCATAADSMTGEDHDPDQELMAQGIANFVVPFFGGIPSTGAIARTAANIRSGGRTPIAAMIHALVLLFIMLVAAPLAKYIPLAVLSALLVVVGIKMGDWKEFIHLRRYPRSDASVFLITFLLTVIFGLTQAVAVGMALACLLFIRRISVLASVGVHPTNRKRGAKANGSTFAPPAAPVNPLNTSQNAQPTSSDSITNEMDKRDIADEVLVVKVTGAMFFGAAQKLKNIMMFLNKEQKVLVLKMNQVVSLDATAILTLADIVSKCQKKGVDVILCGLASQPRSALERTQLLEGLPEANILDDLELALDRAEEILDERR